MSIPELIPPPDPRRAQTTKQVLAEDRRTLSKLRQARKIQQARERTRK